MLSQYILVINTTSKNNQVWARLTDDRVARDDRGRHIECGVYLTNTGKSFAFPSWILIQNPWVERLKSTLGILMWFVVSTVIAYHIGILDQNPMLGTRNFSLCNHSRKVRFEGPKL